MATSHSDLIDWRERDYIPSNGVQTLGIVIQNGEGPLEPDNQDVTANWYREVVGGEEQLISTIPVIRKDVGKYEATLLGNHTDQPGNYRLDFIYSINGEADRYSIYAIVGEPNPHYDNLPPDYKELVDRVWFRFSDCFDSPSGGPNLQSYFQSHWSRGRIAQMMTVALNRLNALGQPHTNFSLTGGGGKDQFPLDSWSGLLESLTYIEALKHLMRSYVEQPQFMAGNNVTRHDRRDYLDRWRILLDIEEQDTKLMIDTFKFSHMFSGGPGVLVAGGVFGRYAPTRVAGNMAARPRHYYRFYT